MREVMALFLDLSIGVRASVVLFILWLIWCLVGRWIIRLFSVVPFAMKTAILVLHRIPELPLSFLHKRFGGVFTRMDNGFSDVMGALYAKLQKPYKALRTNNTSYCGWAFLICLVGVGYFLYSEWIHEPPEFFLIWQKHYNVIEESIIRFLCGTAKG